MYLYRAYGYRGLPVNVGNTDALYIKTRRIGFTLCIKDKRTKDNEKI